MNELCPIIASLFWMISLDAAMCSLCYSGMAAWNGSSYAAAGWFAVFLLAVVGIEFFSRRMKRC